MSTILAQKCYLKSQRITASQKSHNGNKEHKTKLTPLLISETKTPESKIKEGNGQAHFLKVTCRHGSSCQCN